jgi:hypothetical protein
LMDRACRARVVELLARLFRSDWVWDWTWWREVGVVRRAIIAMSTFIMTGTTIVPNLSLPESCDSHAVLSRVCLLKLRQMK